MGSQYFSRPSGMKGTGVGMSARAFGASSFTARSAGAAAQKDLGAASAMARTKAFKRERSSAYALGAKKV